MWCSETLRRPLALLRRSPRELWLVYVLKILDSYGYFALSEVFTTLLTSEFGVSDVRAGAYYGVWGTAIVLYGVLTGFLVDYLGVRTSLVCSYALQTLSRLVIAFTRDRASLFATVFLLHPLASAWGAPVMTIAIKRLTSATDRTVSFGIFYAMMNVAALLSGVAIDALRLGLPHGLVGRDGDPNDAMASPVRVVVASTIVTSLVAAFVAARFRELPPPRDLHRPDADVPSSSTSSLRSLAAASAGLWRERRFRQFLAMALFTLNLKQIFRHMDATFPKYAIRAFGCSAPFGTIYAINPALIIVGVPVVASATADRRHFDVIFRGAWITAAAPFIVAASQTYAGAVAFVVVLSLGEMLWSPRWYDYTMAMAPAGKEGVFGAMALAPLFAAKLPTGILGGYLLQRYCPGAPGPGGDCPAGVGGGVSVVGEGDAARACDGRSMWGIIGAVTMTSPLLIAAFHPWLRDSGDEVDEAGAGDGNKGGAAGRYANLDREGEFDEDDPELELMPLEPTPIGSRR